MHWDPYFAKSISFSMSFISADISTNLLKITLNEIKVSVSTLSSKEFCEKSIRDANKRLFGLRQKSLVPLMYNDGLSQEFPKEEWTAHTSEVQSQRRCCITYSLRFLFLIPQLSLGLAKGVGHDLGSWYIRLVAELFAVPYITSAENQPCIGRGCLIKHCTQTHKYTFYST